MTNQPPKASHKKARLAEAQKRQKRKTQIITVVCSLAAVVLVGLIIYNIIQRTGDTVYTDGSQTVTLRSDGSFAASLAHGVKTGTYSEKDGKISFISDGVTADGSITGKDLTLPHEWEDGHGHGSTLTKK